jgi:hypothetical protein
MSGRLVSLVLESNLPAWVKPYAVAFASFASDDGSKVFPTVKRIARMVSRSERATQTAIAHLRRLRVLEVVAPAGRNTATRYQFHSERLPLPGDGEQRELFSTVAVFPQRNPPNSRTKKGFPQDAQQLTGSGLHPRGEVDSTRSVNRSVKYSPYTRARAKSERQAI